MEMVWACMQKATKIPDKASPTVDPLGTKKQRTAKGDLEEDSGEGPERKRSLLRNGSPNCSGSTKMESSSTTSSARRLREIPVGSPMPLGEEDRCELGQQPTM
ncbi:hypothetical protein ElyMa_003578200 [Elysia marginata]|uniref:Uncharacterized protein n=1 Tax=Elysia marginata TaxID=1093978 RepID=A0AAV4ENV6_9GAST|nr:hypothetical protein ElyMa_003578200 [Elysia marginata]